MSLDLNSVQLFTRVAALGAIGQAGAEFGLSPTSSTQHLQRLEAELGVKLLNRTTRAVSLTSDGEVFLAYAVKILEYIEDITSFDSEYFVVFVKCSLFLL